MTDTRKPSSVLATGRVVMRAHPELGTAAAELLHTLDTLEDDDRVKARAYLLHVYGVAVGCTPSDRRLEELDTWAQDRNALAAAAGHMLGMSELLDPEGSLYALNEAHAHALLEVAHRG